MKEELEALQIRLKEEHARYEELENTVSRLSA
jgi:hypothetical protein